MRTTIVADLVVPDGLIEMSAVAVPSGGERQVIHPSAWMKSPNPYSYGVKTGHTLFIAGLVARNGKDNSVVEGPMAVQTRAVLDNGAEILKAAGMGYEHVVSSRVFYITDVANFDGMNAGYRPVLTKDLPARATVRTGLVNADGVVEIMFRRVEVARWVTW